MFTSGSRPDEGSLQVQADKFRCQIVAHFGILQTYKCSFEDNWDPCRFTCRTLSAQVRPGHRQGGSAEQKWKWGPLEKRHSSTFCPCLSEVHAGQQQQKQEKKCKSLECLLWWSLSLFFCWSMMQEKQKPRNYKLFVSGCWGVLHLHWDVSVDILLKTVQQTFTTFHMNHRSSPWVKNLRFGLEIASGCQGVLYLVAREFCL